MIKSFLSRDVFLATGRLNIDGDLLGTGSFGDDLGLIGFRNDLDGGLLDEDSSTSRSRLSAMNSRGIGDGLQTTFHWPCVGTSIGNILVGGLITRIEVSNCT